MLTDENMLKGRNAIIIEDGIITLVYILLTLIMFLQAEKLLLSQYSNTKMFLCTNFLQVRCENHS